MFTCLASAYANNAIKRYKEAQIEEIQRRISANPPEPLSANPAWNSIDYEGKMTGIVQITGIIESIVTIVLSIFALLSACGILHIPSPGNYILYSIVALEAITAGIFNILALRADCKQSLTDRSAE